MVLAGEGVADGRIHVLGWPSLGSVGGMVFDVSSDGEASSCFDLAPVSQYMEAQTHQSRIIMTFRTKIQSSHLISSHLISLDLLGVFFL